MTTAVRAKDLKMIASGLKGKFLHFQNVNTKHGTTKVFTFETENGPVTIWNNHRLDAPLSSLKRDDEVIIIHNGTSTLPNGHSIEEYQVYKLMQ